MRKFLKYEIKTGNIVAIASIKINSEKGFEVMETDIEGINILNYKIKDGELKEKIKSELDAEKQLALDLQAQKEQDLLEKENKLSGFKVIFDDGTKTTKERLENLVSYLKENGVLKWDFYYYNKWRICMRIIKIIKRGIKWIG